MTDEIAHKLTTRNLRIEDYDTLHEISSRVYKGVALPWTHDQIVRLIDIFPEGQICIEDNGRPVAVALTLIIDFSLFGDHHIYGDEGVRSGLRAQRNALTIFIITGLILFYFIISLPKRILKPFNKIANVLKALGRGETGVIQPSLKKGDEFEALYKSFQEATHSLREYNVLKTEKISALKRQFDTTIAEVKEGVIVLSRELHIITLNSAAGTLFGLASDCIGKSVQDIKILQTLYHEHLIQDISKRVEFKKKVKRTDLKAKQLVIIPIINKDLKTIILIAK